MCQAESWSDFVIKCFKKNKNAEFEQVAKMYRALLGMNPGAAGTAFQIWVHCSGGMLPYAKIRSPNHLATKAKKPKSGLSELRIHAKA